MKNILLFTALFICTIGYSQEQINTQIVTFKESFPTEWTTYVDNQEFSVEYKFVDCDPNMGYDFESVLLKFTNKTSNHLSFSWQIDLFYNEFCRTCDYPVEYARMIDLEPLDSVEGNCLRESNQALKLFSKFNDINYSKGEHLSGFQLSLLTVTGL